MKINKTEKIIIKEVMTLEKTNELDSNKINLQNSDKGNLPSRSLGQYGGTIGGVMTKRLVEMGQKELIEKLNQ